MVQKRKPAGKRRRFSDKERAEIVRYAGIHGVKAAAEKYHVADTGIYKWRKATKPRARYTPPVKAQIPSTVKVDRSGARDSKALLAEISRLKSVIRMLLA
jgi:transposase-like protein